MGLTEEDSEDLTDEEVERAVVATSPSAISQAALEPIKQITERTEGIPGHRLTVKHELRRRKPHLYWRLRLTSSEVAEEVLVFRADWLQQLGEPADGD